MWLACLAIAVYHISVLQAVQKKNQYAKFNKRTGNMMFSYIFNEPQMTRCSYSVQFMAEK